MYKITWKLNKGFFNSETGELYSDNYCDYLDDLLSNHKKNKPFYSFKDLCEIFNYKPRKKKLKHQLNKEIIKSRANILDVAKDYIKDLKIRGQKFNICCPFHPDTKPSMSINVQKNVWYCHTEGRGGDIISFVQELEQCSFNEALNILEKYV